MRGESAVKPSSNLFVSLLDDKSPSVQIVAAEALVHFGSKDARDAAVNHLKARADWASNDVFTTMNAMAALESLGADVVVHADTILQLPENGTAPHSRYNSYVPRLLTNLKELVKSGQTKK